MGKLDNLSSMSWNIYSDRESLPFNLQPAIRIIYCIVEEQLNYPQTWKTRTSKTQTLKTFRL